MGIISGGILGGFSNKTGSVVGARWRKRDVIKGLPRPSKKAATQLQIEQRTKFGIVTGFLRYLSAWIDKAYKKGPGSSSPMNEAVAYHLQNAIIGVAPNFILDYTKLEFSKGRLENPFDYSLDTTAVAKLDFTWTDDGLDVDGLKDATDVINVMAYNPTKNRFVTVMAAAPRSAKSFVLQCPPYFSGDEVYCYFSFTSTKKKNLHSDSTFMFKIPVL
jgi:hypothetical protein